MQTHRYVIVEGHLLFHDRALVDRMTHRFHLDISVDEAKKRRCTPGPHNHNTGFLGSEQYFEECMRQWWESPDGYLQRCVESMDPCPRRFDANSLETLLSGHVAEQMIAVVSGKLSRSGTEDS